MTPPRIADKPVSPLSSIDPRRSLAASAMWLIVALAATFSIAAALWVGSIARENVLQQHIRRLSLETDQLSSDLGQALSVRFDAARAAAYSTSFLRLTPNSIGLPSRMQTGSSSARMARCIRATTSKRAPGSLPEFMSRGLG
jgi:hypothetical protein